MLLSLLIGKVSVILRRVNVKGSRREGNNVRLGGVDLNDFPGSFLDKCKVLPRQYGYFCNVIKWKPKLFNTMKTLQFKTNIKCGGCVAQVTPHLNTVEGIIHWEVDTAHPQKILTVKTDQAGASEVKKAVQNAGFAAEPL